MFLENGSKTQCTFCFVLFMVFSRYFTVVLIYSILYYLLSLDESAEFNISVYFPSFSLIDLFRMISIMFYNMLTFNRLFNYILRKVFSPKSCILLSFTESKMCLIMPK